MHLIIVICKIDTEIKMAIHITSMLIRRILINVLYIIQADMSRGKCPKANMKCNKNKQ